MSKHKITKGDIWTGKRTKQEYEIVEIKGENVKIQNVSNGQENWINRINLPINYRWKREGETITEK